MVAHVHVERDPEPALAVALGSVGVAMVGAGDVPARAGGEVLVGDAVAVRVPQTRGLGPLGHEQVLAVAQQAEGFVQARGEELVGHLVGLGVEHAAEEPDLALADRQRELAVGGPVHAADFEREAVAGLPVLGAGVRRGARGQDVGDLIGRRGKRGGGEKCEGRGFHFQR